MFNLLIGLLLGLAILTPINCYVLLQVRKGENQSNIDALIHKVVPVKENENIANSARKHFSNYKQYKLENKHNDKESGSIIFAVKTDGNENGWRPKGSANQRINNLLTDIKHMFVDFMQRKGGPEYRAKLDKYNIKPELINFRDADGKPSVMYEVETNSILQSLVDALNSRKFKKYSDNLVSTIAYAYHVIKDE